MGERFPEERLRRAGGTRAQVKLAGEYWSAWDDEQRRAFVKELASVKDAVVRETLEDLEAARDTEYGTPTPASEPGGDPAAEPGGAPGADPDGQPAGDPGGAPAADPGGDPAASNAADDAHAPDTGHDDGDDPGGTDDERAALDDEQVSAALDTAATAETYASEHPEHVPQLIEAEKAGKARKTVLAALSKHDPQD